MKTFNWLVCFFGALLCSFGGAGFGLAAMVLWANALFFSVCIVMCIGLFAAAFCAMHSAERY